MLHLHTYIQLYINTHTYIYCIVVCMYVNIIEISLVNYLHKYMYKK